MRHVSDLDIWARHRTAPTISTGCFEFLSYIACAYASWDVYKCIYTCMVFFGLYALSVIFILNQPKLK